MFWAILIIAALVVFWGVSTYNRLVSLRELARNALGQIAAQIESRWDAVSNLIEATKQYSAHEAETLEGITKSRASIGAGRTADVETLEQEESRFQGVLGRLIAVAENYPELKASQVYTRSMDAVDKYENNVRQSRMLYNDSATKLNRAVQQIPASLIAGIGGFTQMPYFEASEGKQDMPSWN